MTSRIVRRPAVAGLFYDADPRSLRRDVTNMLDEARAGQAPIKGQIVGIVTPHAGYPYSGPTAAHAYAALAGREFDTAVLVGPSHRDLFPGISVYLGDAFATPLGEVEVDRELAQALAEKSGVIEARKDGHGAEHALEVQIPFLQISHPKAKIVPLTMCDQDPDTCVALALALSDVLQGRSAVVIASSDLSHFHPYHEAMEMDQRVAELIRTYNAERLSELLVNETVEACGGGPIVAVMRTAAALGAKNSTVLFTCNSGDRGGDRGSVVGYLAAAFWK